MIRHPFGSTERVTIYASGGIYNLPISAGVTIIETEALTDDVTINLELDNDLTAGSEIHVICTTSGTEVFTFGDNIEAPAITGEAGKTWSQSFIFNGEDFLPSCEYSFTEGDSCPSITLGNIQFTGGDGNYLVYDIDSVIAFGEISGGSPVYNPTVVSGAIPTGTSLDVAEDSGTWYWRISGKTTEFGSFTFTIGGTDGNGCQITPREYTIEVWQINDGNGTVETTIFINVSGLPTQLGVNVILDHIEYNVNLSSDDLVNYEFLTQDGDVGYSFAYIPVGFISGTSVVNANIYSSASGNPLINTGSEPYTGDWGDIYDWSSHGITNPNSTWLSYVAGGGPTGTFNVRMFFKPI